jgi:CRISPR-associated protein (TIGR02710 family)
VDEKVILLLTVGGSHEPVVRAIRERRPARVVFFCSGRDPGTGRAGSCTQITGQGHVIKARTEDSAPSLPNIPVQAGLTAEDFEVIEVPTDDLDEAFTRMTQVLARVREKAPQARLIADYTGGTKTMSAALVLAALESPGVELELVTGNRANLQRVVSGTEYLAVASVERLRTERAMGQALAAWGRFGYAEAANALERLPPPADHALAVTLNRARDLSRAFEAWDRFDHSRAHALLEPYAAVLSAGLARSLTLLKLAASAEESSQPRREALLIEDLWLNAERRAAARFDDAVARAYRVIEWTAQWLLRAHLGIDTADVPPDRVPPGIDIRPGRDGRRQAGLFAAWQLLAHHLPQRPAAQFFAREERTLLDLLQARNRSILAHGFAPIGKDAWGRMRRWMNEGLMPCLRQEAEHFGQRAFFEQLPVNIEQALRAE